MAAAAEVRFYTWTVYNPVWRWTTSVHGYGVDRAQAWTAMLVLYPWVREIERTHITET